MGVAILLSVPLSVSIAFSFLPIPSIISVLLFLPTVIFIFRCIEMYQDRLTGLPSVPLGARLKIVGSKNGVELFNQFMTNCQTYGEKTGIFKIRTILHPVYMITKPETAELLLSSSKNITKSLFYSFLFPWLGRGLLTSTGEKWQKRRKMLTPTFHFKILSDFLQVFNEQAAIMVKRLDRKANGGTFDITPYVTLCALDIICDTAMGIHIDAQSNSESEYVKAIYRISEMIMVRIRRPHLWPKYFFRKSSAGTEHYQCLRILHDFTNKVIRERKAEMKTSDQSGADEVKSLLRDDKKENVDDEDDYYTSGLKKKRRRLAFLDLLLQIASEDDSLTDRDIREEVDTFMFEGHDTTAAAVNWVVHLLGANPDAQERVRQETDQIFGDTNRAVTMDDIKELKYLECVIKESLRLFPSVPLFARHVTNECNIGGFTVPEGASAVVMTSFIHMDPNHFPDPERFDPDRWLPENSIDRHPFCFVPFSAGPRNCIGQKFAMIEEKVLLTNIVRNFEITAKQTREELRPCGELILRPEKGILVQIRKRVPPQ